MDGFVPKAAQEGRACGNYQEETEDQQQALFPLHCGSFFGGDPEEESEKTEVRAAAREAALREIKERIKKTKDEKKAKKVEVASKPKPGKTATRAPQAKPAKTGAGGKR